MLLYYLPVEVEQFQLIISAQVLRLNSDLSVGRVWIYTHTCRVTELILCANDDLVANEEVLIRMDQAIFYWSWSSSALDRKSVV